MGNKMDYTGWLSPHGFLNPCGYSQHYDLALYICSKIDDYGLIKGGSYRDTYETDLERFGWIKIQCGCVVEPMSLGIDDSLFVTGLQKKFIEANNIECIVEMRVSDTFFITKEITTEDWTG